MITQDYQVLSTTIFGNEVTPFYLYPIQVTAVRWMQWIESKIGTQDQLSGGLLCDAMGLGKTKTMAALTEVNLVPTTLVIVPLTTLRQTAREFLKLSKRLYIYEFGDHDYLTRFTLAADGEQLISENLTRKKQQEFLFPGVLLINKEKLDLGSKCRKLIEEFNWFRIFLDEAHVIRNGTSTQFFKNLDNIPQPEIVINGKRERMGTRWAITGTPIQNEIMDIIWTFKWVDDRSFVDPKVQNDELKYRIRHSLFRRSKDQITPEMKEIMSFPQEDLEIHIERFSLPDTPLARDLSQLSYPQIQEKLKNTHFANAVARDEKAFVITKVSKVLSEGGDKIMSIRTLLSFPFVSQNYGTLKEFTGFQTKPHVIKRIIGRYEGESFVLFHQWNPIREFLKEFFRRELPRYIIREIHGDQRITERDRILLECNSLIDQGKSVLLFSSLKATSEGLNYQKFSKMIIIDQDFNPQEEHQAMDRIYRIGQKNKVNVWLLSLDSFNTFYGEIHIDDRQMTIKEEKTPLAKIIDETNAAFYWKRFYFLDQQGRLTSGTWFGAQFESLPSGQVGGPDSVGPDRLY